MLLVEHNFEITMLRSSLYLLAYEGDVLDFVKYMFLFLISCIICLDSHGRFFLLDKLDLGMHVCIISRNEFCQLIQVAFGFHLTMMESESSSQRRSLGNAWLYLQIFHGMLGLGLGPIKSMDANRPKWSLNPRGEMVEQLLVRTGLVVSATLIVVSELSVTSMSCGNDCE